MYYTLSATGILCSYAGSVRKHAVDITSDEVISDSDIILYIYQL